MKLKFIGGPWHNKSVDCFNEFGEVCAFPMHFTVDLDWMNINSWGLYRFNRMEEKDTVAIYYFDPENYSIQKEKLENLHA